MRRRAAAFAQVEIGQQSDEQMGQGFRAVTGIDQAAALRRCEKRRKAPVEMIRRFGTVGGDMAVAIKLQAQTQGLTPVGTEAGFTTGRSRMI